MGQKIALVKDSSDARYIFQCPGCKDIHQIPTEGPKAWGFNKNIHNPTFTPSILVRAEGFWDDDLDKYVSQPLVCHSYVTDGKIQFLSDCTHSLVNQTVELSDVPDKWKDM